MEERSSDKAEVKSTPETEKSEKVEPEKELGNGDEPETEKSEKVEPEKELGNDDGQSQLRHQESVGITDADMEDLHDEGVQRTLAKDQVEGARENSAVEPNGEDLGEVKEKDSGKEIENREVETSPCLTPSSDPSMVEPSLSSDPSTKQEQRANTRVSNSLSVSPVLRTPARDGYNWRKYGQKQVKSPKGSRSYYRCSYSECCAKKIECSNDSGKVIEIVNKGLHSHEPPRKNIFSPREVRPVSSMTPASENVTVVKELPIVPVGSDPSTSTKQNICESHTIVERKRHSENEAMEEPELKRRLKKDNAQSSDSVSKPGKKNRFVVHAAGDVGISGDGYRWRKYGQKMVKGNPNPRNYYRCTSAGCPVRKHIETAVENSTAVVITYNGVHNHDTPVPEKRHGPPSTVLVAAATDKIKTSCPRTKLPA